MSTTPRLEQKNLRLAYKLAGVALVFSALGFAMVPLYDVICKWTGINGKTNAQAVAAISNTQVDTSRLVTVQFLSHAMPGAGLVFKPEHFSMSVHPGEMVYTHYVVEKCYARQWRFISSEGGVLLLQPANLCCQRSQNTPHCFLHQQRH
jgi:cytochrome c oxidase assembly protein Cox11